MNIKSKLLGLAVLATTSIGFGTVAYADSIYTVKSGDTLSEISYNYLGTIDSIENIAKNNNITNVHLIYPGQKLNLSSDGEIRVATPEEVATQPEVATVEEATPIQETVVQSAVDVNTVSETTSEVTGRQITVQATAYDGVSLGGLTASGYMIKGYGDKVIAVDPSVIPLGSTVYVPGYGTAIAADTGGAIKGNIIDLNMSTADAIQWGRRTITITVL